MRAAWILTSTWEAVRLPIVLAGSVVLGSFANPVLAQAVSLTLNLSRRLADAAIVDPGKAVPSTKSAMAVPGLRLALSDDLTITRAADSGRAPATAAGPPAGTGGAPPQPATNLTQSETVAPARTPRASAGEMEELVLEIDVNQQGLNETAIVLRAKDGAFFVSEEDLGRWRLRKPGVVALHYRGINYYPAASIPGAKFQFDRVKQALRITAGAEAFGETVSKASRPDLYPAPILPQPGGFL